MGILDKGVRDGSVSYGLMFLFLGDDSLKPKK